MTPEPIAADMVKLVKRPVEEWVVLDPAAGDGNLLLAAVRKMQDCGVANIQERIFGVEIDPDMAAVARKRLMTAIGCGHDEVKILCGDFLDAVRRPLYFSSFIRNSNVVVSNPPYGHSREYQFLTECNDFLNPETEIIFLMPLAALDRVSGPKCFPLPGRPLGVTTGHAIMYHKAGEKLALRPIKTLPTNSRSFEVLSGIKIYEKNAGNPPQTDEVLKRKPYSFRYPKEGLLPCLRTGDVQPFSVSTGRLWISYGLHLAHPKDLARFSGPKLFVRRMPVWATRQMAAAFDNQVVLCAGDVLVVRQASDDEELLRGLCVYLNSPEAAAPIFMNRPSFRYRTSFPKISAKDLNWLFDNHLPEDSELRVLAKLYPSAEIGGEHQSYYPSSLSDGRRLMDVGFPLEEVSEAAAQEKSIRQGHLSTLQMWWARRPLGVCRSAIFAAICPSPEEIEKSPDLLRALNEFDPENISTRDKLLQITASLAPWNARENHRLLSIAGKLMMAGPASSPTVVDTFAGGGSIPVEALRLGLNAYAADLNPVATAGLKAAIEYLPSCPSSTLAEFDEVALRIERRIADTTRTLYGEGENQCVLAFFWCRTFVCPQCGYEAPLLRDKWLAKSPRTAAVRINSEPKRNRLEFEVYPPSTKSDIRDADSGTVKSTEARCSQCGHRVSTKWLRERGMAGELGDRLYAKLVVDQSGQKSYQAVTARDESLALGSKLKTAAQRTQLAILNSPLDINGIRHTWAMQYGIRTHSDLYNVRQKVALFSVLNELEKVKKGFLRTGHSESDTKLFCLLLAFALNRLVMYGSRHAWWQPNGEFPANMFVRQAIPMVWSYVEIPVSSPGAGGWHSALSWISKVAMQLSQLPKKGRSWQGDAAQCPLPDKSVDLVAVDPPYYDSIAYGYLSDPFYIWMKAFLGDLFPHEFQYPVTPKKEEAIVDRSHQLATAAKTGKHFRAKMLGAFKEARRVLTSRGRLLVMFGHKKYVAWDALLGSLMEAGFVPSVSWPVQMERKVKFRHGRVDALSASCLILCTIDGKLEKRRVGWNTIKPHFKDEIRSSLLRFQGAHFFGADLATSLIAPACSILRDHTILSEDGRVMSIGDIIALLPALTEDCEYEMLIEHPSLAQSPRLLEIVKTLRRAQSPPDLNGSQSCDSWLAFADKHALVGAAAQFSDLLSRQNARGATEIWGKLDPAQRDQMRLFLRAAALLSPEGSRERQIAQASLGRISLMIKSQLKGFTLDNPQLPML